MRTKPKKSLGQNFLFDKNVQNKIVRACMLQPSDTVLEVGSGYGALTGLISSSVKQVYALEIDGELCNFLNDNFGSRSNISIINRDILKFDLRTLMDYSLLRAPKVRNNPGFEIAQPGPSEARDLPAASRNDDNVKVDTNVKIKVIGNIPYYITSPIIEHLFAFRDIIDVIYLTVQKEFAERIIAVPGSKTYGSFSCFVQYHGVPEILFLIKKNSFKPAPKVDSCFIRIVLRPRPAVEVKDEASLFKIIRKAFNQRRKTLRNSLSGVVPAKKLRDFFVSRALDVNIRPEDMALEDFAALANIYE